MCIESVKKQREKKKQRTCKTGSLGWIFVCTWSDYLVVLCFTIVVVIKEGAQDSVGTAFRTETHRKEKGIIFYK